MKNQDGFTLLSMMLALSILTITLFLAVSTLSVMGKQFEDNASITHKDVRLFFSQTSRELHLSQTVSCSPNHRQLILNKNNEQIVFQPSYPQRVIRLVNGLGYEIVLQHVKNIQFQCTGAFVSIQVIDTQGRSYYWSDRLYLEKGG
ncbi:competence type IV pilus minor pilin ComGF [Sporolactobacillus putidus]|uniref:Competence protein ComGF n=1 Tax=Sporolactobacillus putidus TaxID=492735 RepID=A0A917S8L7_9BACL|nr:competence type IV pilus minor pilin ComGF [Sporolactobacillus putidus]GGL61471.1 hypothetical protein GCM10007968_26840 [Sporolactobacillus putidus]